MYENVIEKYGETNWNELYLSQNQTSAFKKQGCIPRPGGDGGGMHPIGVNLVNFGRIVTPFVTRAIKKVYVLT